MISGIVDILYHSPFLSALLFNFGIGLSLVALSFGPSSTHSPVHASEEAAGKIENSDQINQNDEGWHPAMIGSNQTQFNGTISRAGFDLTPLSGFGVPTRPPTVPVHLTHKSPPVKIVDYLLEVRKWIRNMKYDEAYVCKRIIRPEQPGRISLVDPFTADLDLITSHHCWTRTTYFLDSVLQQEKLEGDSRPKVRIALSGYWRRRSVLSIGFPPEWIYWAFALVPGRADGERHLLIYNPWAALSEDGNGGLSPRQADVIAACRQVFPNLQVWTNLIALDGPPDFKERDLLSGVLVWMYSIANVGNLPILGGSDCRIFWTNMVSL